jgi:prepilin-type N-terminal cleavage/methylation domain-containing protein
VSRGGFTLTELVVVTVLVSILGMAAAYAYRGHVEGSRADAARQLALVVAHGNRMAAMDNLSRSTTSAAGFFPLHGQDGLLKTPRAPCGPPWDGASLARCRQVGLTDWDRQPYLFRACSGDRGGGGCCQTCPPGTIACARRKMNGPNCTGEPAAEAARDMEGAAPAGKSELMGGDLGLAGGTGLPFCEWRYCVDSSDRVTPLYGAP